MPSPQLFYEFRASRNEPKTAHSPIIRLEALHDAEANEAVNLAASPVTLSNGTPGWFGLGGTT